jgi:hypothetical protein
MPFVYHKLVNRRAAVLVNICTYDTAGNRQLNVEIRYARVYQQVTAVRYEKIKTKNKNRNNITHIMCVQIVCNTSRVQRNTNLGRVTRVHVVYAQRNDYIYIYIYIYNLLDRT